MTARPREAGRWARFLAEVTVGVVAAALAAPGLTAPSPPTLVEGDLAALRDVLSAVGGRPTVVNFWATWCAPCVHEIPLLNELRERLAPQGVRFLAVSLDPFIYQDPAEARAKVSRLVAEKGFRLPVFLYLGGQESLSQMYDLPPGLPYTLLLGADGKVLERVAGQLEPSEVERIEKAARAAVAVE
jgi:thiol-disulfide isomerase/thioredoxin